MPEKTTEMILVKSKGFTLIELLVVIAIISLLVSILLPSLKKAQELAKRAVCSISLKNAGLAMNMYAEDSDGVFVTHMWLEPYYLADNYGEPYGINSLYRGGYLENEKDLFCPEDEQGEIGLHYLPGYTPRTFYGYGYSELVNTAPTARTFYPLRLGDVSNAAGTIVYSDKMWNAATFYHEEGCNAVFVDGHAAWIPDQNGILKDFIRHPDEGGIRPPYYGGVPSAEAYKLMEYLAGNNNPELFPDYLNLPDADGYGL
jgi:prepilin-type N-terminal cleavage/methylation domain-containing protein/prepilin-type processing-associated H-X9-DG protein